MITENFADFIISTTYSEIPQMVIEKAKICFIDFLGVSLAGSRIKSGSIIKEIIGKGDESTVIGSKKSSALDSSLANGIFAHAMDLDDGNRFAQLHPGSCVIPSALAICESRNKSGRDFLTSIVIGYEIAIILGMMANPSHRNRGFHSTGTCGTFGAAAAAAKSMNLEKENTVNALGIAGTQTCGLLESDHAGSMAKHLHAGKAAQSGLLSALLADKGYNGAKSILEGEEGFFNATTDIDLLNNNELFDDITLGEYHIRNVYFKKYPVCRHLHSSLDSLIHLIRKNNISSHEVEEIVVKTYKIAAQHDNYYPTNLESLRQSLPMVLAISCIKGQLDYTDISQDDINYDIYHMAEKAVIEESDEYEDLYPEKRPSKVVIKTINKKYDKIFDLPKGEPENPFTKSDIIQKFSRLNPKIDVELLDMINHIENYNMKEFMEILNQEFIRVY
ncbi:MAG: MmgE/PrpD family protein [Methanomicrobiales archaeon]